MPIKKTSVIVLAFNSQKYIYKCLQSILKQTKIEDELILVDNSSSDETVCIVQKIKDKRLKIIKNKQNLGFSRGVNIGIKASSGDMVILVNPDTQLKPGSIESLKSCLVKNKASIVGGKAYKPNGKLHSSFVKAPTGWTLLFDYTNLRKLIPFDYFHKTHYYLYDKRTNKDKRVDAVSGAFMAITKKTFQRIGYFDEDFFMYLEDIDFCIRAKQQKMKIFFCPHAQIVHFGGRSSRNKYHTNLPAWYLSRAYYTKKHFSVLCSLLLTPIYKTDQLISTLWLQKSLSSAGRS